MPAGYVWYTDPGVVVTQSCITHATLEHTAAMTARVDAVLRFKQVDLAALGGLLIIHDWRSLKTWDNESRQLIVERSRARGRGVVRSAVIAVSINPLLRMLAQVVNLTMSVIGGAGVEVVDSVVPALRKFAVQMPQAYARFPGGP